MLPSEQHTEIPETLVWWVRGGQKHVPPAPLTQNPQYADSLIGPRTHQKKLLLDLILMPTRPS